MHNLFIFVLFCVFSLTVHGAEASYESFRENFEALKGYFRSRPANPPRGDIYNQQDVYLLNTMAELQYSVLAAHKWITAKENSHNSTHKQRVKLLAGVLENLHGVFGQYMLSPFSAMSPIVQYLVEAMVFFSPSYSLKDFIKQPDSRVCLETLVDILNRPLLRNYTYRGKIDAADSLERYFFPQKNLDKSIFILTYALTFNNLPYPNTNCMEYMLKYCYMKTVVSYLLGAPFVLAQRASFVEAMTAFYASSWMNTIYRIRGNFENTDLNSFCAENNKAFNEWLNSYSENHVGPIRDSQFRFNPPQRHHSDPFTFDHPDPSTFDQHQPLRERNVGDSLTMFKLKMSLMCLPQFICIVLIIGLCSFK